MVKAWHKRSVGSVVFDVCLYTFLIVLTFLFLYPFWSTLVVSFSTSAQANSLGLKWWPSPITTYAYEKSLQYKSLYSGYANTILRASVGGAMTVFVTMLGAYVLSKKTLPLRKAFTLFILFTMFFSGGLIPSYMLIRNLGLINNRWVFILPGLTSAWWLILTRNFISALPDSMEEAAVMDGAGPLRILLRIIFPLSMPIIAVVALQSIVGHWNSWFDSLLYIKSVDKMPLQHILRRLVEISGMHGASSVGEIANLSDISAQKITEQSLKNAMIMLSIGPIILAYPFLQKYFVKGIMVGSLKG